MACLRVLVWTALLWTLTAGPAAAHPAGRPPARAETIQVGPYAVVVEFSTWPIRQHGSVEMTIKPAGGVAGLRAWSRVTERAAFGNQPFNELRTYPGTTDGWVIHLVEPFPPGTRLWEFKLDGPRGQGMAQYTGYQVVAAPWLPMWAGWLVGLTPFFGLTWFGLREWRRVRRRLAADGGARVA